jgi:tetratricopeptide (TPR) repeat protein
MKRIALTFTLTSLLVFNSGFAQSQSDNSKFDILLIKGDYTKAVDTCKLILAIDSLNSEIWYKIGLAYQNLLSEDKSFYCFSKAATISPDNNRFTFMLAKSYYNKGKPNQAKPILVKLCASDSMNWGYAYYLTSIYMQEGNYDESIEIYNRFYNQDTLNSVILDKIGFASIKKGDYDSAIDLFNRSLALNKKNLNTLKNLAFLYSSTNNIDTAIQLLTSGISMDPSDLDLYIRRASIYYLINYNKRALNDYLKVLSSGDSAFLYLKRAGIGYSNNLQPKEAVKYLRLAYKKDSSDYETASYLGQNYYNLNDPKNSIYYYNRVIRILSPITRQMGIASVMLAEAQKAGGLYKEAINTYLSALKISSDLNLYMIIANLYDDKLNDITNAIYYYELFLNKIKPDKTTFKSDYVESVKKRLEFLKEKLNKPGK